MNHLAFLVEGGPFMNLLLMLASYPLRDSSIPELVIFGSTLHMVNKILAISNLIPVWKLDAGLLGKMISTSLNKRQEKLLTLGMLCIWVIIILIVLLVSLDSVVFNQWTLLAYSLLHIDVILVGVIFTIGMIRIQSIDDDMLADGPKTLTNAQVVMHIFIHMVLLLGALAL